MKELILIGFITAFVCWVIMFISLHETEIRRKPIANFILLVVGTIMWALAAVKTMELIN